MDSGQQALVKKRKKRKKRGGGLVWLCVFVWINLLNIVCAATKISVSALYSTEQGVRMREKKRRESSVQSRSTSLFLLTQRKYYAATRAH